MDQQPLRFPALIVFISNTCLMVLELVAGRLMASYLGVSLYTWTSIIGVILAGITVGNYLGGWLADRRASRQLLGAIFLACAAASLVVLPLNSLMRSASLFVGAPLEVRIVLVTSLIFLPVSILLGLISPMVVKLSLASLDRTGQVVGRIYAAGAAGSILGTFATGFVLISRFGTHRVVIGVGVVLALTGIVVGQVWRRAPALALVALVSLGSVGALARADLLDAPCLRESNYFCITIRNDTESDREVRALVLDRLIHSWIDIEDPRVLRYGYETIYRDVVQNWMLLHQLETPDSLFIGGGGYTFPRYLESTHPQSQIDVVEIDPAVTEVAEQYLGLAADGPIRTFNADARAFFNALAPETHYHFIFGDAFNDFSVPYHLTTREFAAHIRAHLSPQGLYLANIIDGRQGLFLRAFVQTLQTEFPHVAVIPTTPNWHEIDRSTFVILASTQPFNSLHPIMSGMLPPETLNAFLEQGPPLILTDDYVPVDNLLAPVYRDSGF